LANTNQGASELSLAPYCFKNQGFMDYGAANSIVALVRLLLDLFVEEQTLVVPKIEMS
jgi:hypothetical protein